MLKKMFLMTMILLLASIFTGDVQAHEAGPGHTAAASQIHSLFLISGKLPHLMQPIKAHWDDPALGLSKEQKAQLKNVQKQSMAAVKRLQNELPPLIDRVKTGMMAGKTPEELRPLVDKIAELKTLGTMTHLNCLHQVRNILSKEQLAMIKKLAGK